MAYVDDRQIWDDLSPSRKIPGKLKALKSYVLYSYIFIHWLKIGCQKDHDVDHVSLVFAEIG